MRLGTYPPSGPIPIPLELDSQRAVLTLPPPEKVGETEKQSQSTREKTSSEDILEPF